MKKLILTIILISFVFAFAGCKSTYSVKFKDYLSGEYIQNVVIDGKEYKGETFALSKGKHKVESDFYGPFEFEVDKDSVIELFPKSYLYILTNCPLSKVLVNGESVNFKEKNLNGKDAYVVSPLKEGKYNFTLESPLFKKVEKEVRIDYGENLLEVNLTFDKNNYLAFIDSLNNPMDENGIFNIKISGSANGNNVSKTLTVKKDNDTLTISDDCMTYTFKGNTLLESTLTEEEKAILNYAKATVENFLNFKSYLKNMALINQKGNIYFAKNEGTFEGQNIDESVSFEVKDNSIAKLIISIAQVKSNTNLVVEVEVKK